MLAIIDKMRFMANKIYDCVDFTRYIIHRMKHFNIYKVLKKRCTEIYPIIFIECSHQNCRKYLTRIRNAESHYLIIPEIE